MVGKYCLFGIHDLDGNTVVIRENGTVKPYLAFTDNLGGILSVMDENGTRVFGASCDAWGKQTVTLNTIGLHRGYTGHRNFWWRLVRYKNCGCNLWNVNVGVNDKQQ